MLPTNFRVNWPFGSGKEVKKKSFKMAAMTAILDFWPERFKLFLIYKSPQCFLPSFESIGLSVQEKKWKIDFQDGPHGGYLRFPIGTTLAIFDLQVTLMLPTKFQVKWPFGSGEEVKNSFSRQPPWRPSSISDRNYYSYFLSTSHPQFPTKFRVNWPFGSGAMVKNRVSRRRPLWPSWVSKQNNFSYFWPTSHPDASYQVSCPLAQRCFKLLLTLHTAWQTIAHHEHFMLRWAKN